MEMVEGVKGVVVAKVEEEVVMAYPLPSRLVVVTTVVMRGVVAKVAAKVEARVGAKVEGAKAE